ncbi:hypothetical protein GJ496_006097, partial [Pomphorhynchus laevis]
IFLYFNGVFLLWNLCGSILNNFSVKNEIAQSNIFLTVILLINFIENLPFKLYFNFVIEEKFGFNKQTLMNFLTDQLKKNVFVIMLVIPIISGLIKIIKWKGDSFFLYAGVFVVTALLIILMLYPDFIAPLFDNFKLMNECILKDRISELASKVNFPSFKIYIVEGSKKSSHSNAYFVGLFKTRRIVLYDTLVGHLIKNNENKEEFEDTVALEDDQCTKEHAERRFFKVNTDEILSVLAHELGHWKHAHLYKALIISIAQIFLQFYAFSFLYKWPFIYEAFGFKESMPVLIGMFISFGMLFTPLNVVDELFSTWLSRRFERQADEIRKSRLSLL